MKTITVTVRGNGNGFTARAGRGKKAKTGTCTYCPRQAARYAAAKAFCLDECNVQGPQDILVEGNYDHCNGGTYTATLPDLPDTTAKGEA